MPSSTFTLFISNKRLVICLHLKLGHFSAMIITSKDLCWQNHPYGDSSETSVNFRWSGEILFNIAKLSYMSSTEPQCRLQSDGMMPHKAAMKLWLNLVFHCWVQMKPGPGPSLDVSQRPYKHINWRCEPNNIQILLSSWGWLRPVPGDNTRNETIIIIITILILVNVWSVKLVHLLDISAFIGIFWCFQKLLI